MISAEQVRKMRVEANAKAEALAKESESAVREAQAAAQATLRMNIERNLLKIEKAIVDAAYTKTSLTVEYSQYDDPKQREVIDGVVAALKGAGYEIMGQEVTRGLGVGGFVLFQLTNLEVTISW